MEVVRLTAIDGGFHPKRDNGESVPCVQKDRKNLGRIPKENSVYSSFGLGNHPRSSSFHFSGVAPPLVPHQMCSLLDATKQSQKRSGHPF